MPIRGRICPGNRNRPCRVAYVNLVIESGASVKETQELARHSMPDLTMHVYGRTREDRLTNAVERIGEVVLAKPIRAPRVHRLAGGEEQKSATPIETGDCAALNLGWMTGIEPATSRTTT